LREFEPKTCPGVSDYVRPVPQYVSCPKCGGTVEIWSDEKFGRCEDCGHEFPRVSADASCLEWCPYADRCREMISGLKR